MLATTEEALPYKSGFSVREQTSTASQWGKSRLIICGSRCHGRPRTEKHGFPSHAFSERTEFLFVYGDPYWREKSRNRLLGRAYWADCCRRSGARTTSLHTYWQWGANQVVGGSLPDAESPAIGPIHAICPPIPVIRPPIPVKSNRYRRVRCRASNRQRCLTKVS